MNPISNEEFLKFLSRSAITRTPLEVGVGAQLTSENHQTRVVTIHFIEDEPIEYVSKVLRILLNLENHWIVFPRHGRLDEIFGDPAFSTSPAVEVGRDEIEFLIDAMIGIQQNNRVIETDPYVLAATGGIYTPWDHHVYPDGFNILFSDVAKSTQFISALNEFGAEFDVYYANA